jgi:Tol biopolymer transport system component
VSVTSAGALLYVNDPQPNTQLAWMDVQSGKVTSRLQLPPAFYSDPSVSPDGRSAVVRRNDTPTTSSLWLLDLASGVDLQPVTLAASRNYAQRWSFDGKRLFFTSDREGIEQIFVKDIGSSAAERVLFRTPALFKQARSVSPDGKWLIFQELTDQTDIWMFSLTGDDKPQPLLRTPADESDPSVSPDGRWLSYTSNKSGRSEVYVDAFPHGGREVQITTEGGFGSAWHQNGRQLMTDNERGIFVQDLIIGAEVRRGQRRRLPLEEFRGMYGADVDPALQRALVALAKEGSTRTSLIYVTGWDAKLPRRR